MNLEQENQHLREEVATLREKVENLTALLTAQNQSSVPLHISTSLVHLNTSTMPIVTVRASSPQHITLEGYLWSTPFNSGEQLRPVASEVQTPLVQKTTPIPHSGPAFPQVTMTYSVPLIHTTQRDSKVDNLLEQYNELNRELRAFHGKSLFDKKAHELCLVPNIVIPPKFKVPDFVKYKGNTCPKGHLKMYVRKMSAQDNNDDLLIHCFQESLIGASLMWYMELNRVDIKTFEDLGEAFAQQYKYNMDLAPNISELWAMTQGTEETFKEYAQRWREVAAQVRPPLEEDELAKTFLNTLDQFYFEKMVASAPHDFAGMMAIGMNIDEAVRKGKLFKESAPNNNFEQDFSNENDQEVSMVKCWPQPQTSGYQPQFPKHQQQPRQRPPRTRIDPIPMTYAELLPILLEMNLVHTKAPLPVPAKLPAGYRADLFCAFHQGAPGHDVENCFPLKKIVQKLIQKNLLPFLD